MFEAVAAIVNVAWAIVPFLGSVLEMIPDIDASLEGVSPFTFQNKSTLSVFTSLMVHRKVVLRNPSYATYFKGLKAVEQGNYNISLHKL